jgi:hypothetical protein
MNLHDGAIIASAQAACSFGGASGAAVDLFTVTLDHAHATAVVTLELGGRGDGSHYIVAQGNYVISNGGSNIEVTDISETSSGGGITQTVTGNTCKFIWTDTSTSNWNACAYIRASGGGSAGGSSDRKGLSITVHGN